MSNYNESNASNVMLAFMVGAIAGAAVALLFAPATGEEARDYLNQRARDSRDRARDVVEQGREFYERNRESVSTAIDRGREAFQQARERSEQA